MTHLSVIEDEIGAIARGPIVGSAVLEREETIQVLDPALERPLATIAAGSAEDALLAVDAAEAAMPAWAAASPRHRAEVLRRAFELMTTHAEGLAQLIVLENGKALHDARSEVAYAAEFFRWYSEEAVRLTGSLGLSPSGANRIMVSHQPIGVSLLITPWNFPAAMATRKIGPALAAGCAVVLKPARETPLTALAIAQLLRRAGVPAGVVNVVPANDSDAISRRLLADPRVRKVSFTGSTPVGRRLLELSSGAVVSAAMELGGNAPFVVLQGADLDRAVDGAMIAKLRNGGSACTAANRMIVHESLAPEFGAELARRMKTLVVGAGIDERTDIGPLVNAKTRDKVAALVQGALDQGAVAATGGGLPDGPGYFVDPTVLVDVPAHADILDEEIFGPVAPVVSFSTEAEAIAMANSTEYGLVSYVYSGDLAAGLRVSEAMDSGMVGLNRAVVSDPAAPFGGTKQSGLGREGGHEGMLEFTESKYIALDW